MHAHIYANKPHRPMHDQAYTWTEQIHNHNTRRSNRKYCFLPSEKGRAHVNMEHFTRRYAQVWNSIPDDIRVEARKNPFKRKLSQWLLLQQQLEQNTNEQ